MLGMTELPTVDAMCSGCYFWLKTGSQHGRTVGLCRRYPKTEDKASYDWCGEWRAKGKAGPTKLPPDVLSAMSNKSLQCDGVIIEGHGGRWQWRAGQWHPFPLIAQHNPASTDPSQ